MAETQKPEDAKPTDPSHYAESSARENLIEHVFLGELLRGLWRKNVRDLEVLRPEVDSGGYDLALEFRGLTVAEIHRLGQSRQQYLPCLQGVRR
jgi:hypothetical protein